MLPQRSCEFSAFKELDMVNSFEKRGPTLRLPATAAGNSGREPPLTGKSSRAMRPLLIEPASPVASLRPAEMSPKATLRQVRGTPSRWLSGFPPGRHKHRYLTRSREGRENHTASVSVFLTRVFLAFFAVPVPISLPTRPDWLSGACARRPWFSPQRRVSIAAACRGVGRGSAAEVPGGRKAPAIHPAVVGSGPGAIGRRTWRRIPTATRAAICKRNCNRCPSRRRGENGDR